VIPAIEPVDELAIRAVLIRYATAIDTKDWQLFRACFTDDCSARFGGLIWRGVDVVADVFEQAHAPLDDSMHRVLNISVLSHDEDTATARSYCDAVLVRRAAAGGAVLVVGGVYSDALRRDGAVWRIANRHFRAVSYRGSFEVLGLDPEQVEIGYGEAVRDV
jgi:3-phenylpropionate/cinnamic acid dioxygenase small subunit